MMKTPRTFRIASAIAAFAVVIILGLFVAQRAAHARRLGIVRLAFVPDDPATEVLSRRLAEQLADRLVTGGHRESRLAPVVSSSDESGGDFDLVVRPIAGETPIDDLIAVDPYVLVLHTASVAAAPDTVDSLLRRLASLPGDTSTPLVVAGDDPLDFACFILYLSSEWLSSSSYSVLTYFLFEGLPANYDESTEEYVGDMVDLLEPVIVRLGELRDAGVLAVNWNDWDRIAVRDSLVRVDAAAAFVPRSEIDSIERERRFYLVVTPPPTGRALLRYRVAGRGMAATTGDGPRSDALEAVRALLRSDELQRLIESESHWSPVVVPEPPINIEHRDIARWIARSEAFVAVDHATAAHPLFRRLHLLLR